MTLGRLSRLLCLILAGGGGHALAAEPSIAVPGAPAVRVHGPMAAARSIIAAEEAFEARAQGAGAAVAMRDYLDPVDGLTFAGGEPARGAAAIYAAHGGDHPAGSLWGHFRFVPPGHSPAAVTGKYVTVWRHGADGIWKGIIDIGSPD